MEKLNTLRLELAVGKSRYNKFGNFYYRSQEDILEAVKPLLAKHKLFMTISDEMVMLGDRFYVKATISIQEDDRLSTQTAIGYAREPENKKGMDESQITGTASSYARKYALNAMFLIDDTKDAGTDEYHNITNEGYEPKKQNKSTPVESGETMKSIIEFVQNSKMTEENKAMARREVGKCKGDERQLKTVLKNLKNEFGDKK